MAMPVMPVPVMAMPAVMMVPVMMMMPPAHLGRRLLRVRPHRRGRARIAQRQRLRLLRRSCDRKKCEDRRKAQGIEVFFPSPALSTDNAAMIAAAAYPKFLVQDILPSDFSAEAGLRLGETRIT